MLRQLTKDERVYIREVKKEMNDGLLTARDLARAQVSGTWDQKRSQLARVVRLYSFVTGNPVRVSVGDEEPLILDHTPLYRFFRLVRGREITVVRTDRAIEIEHADKDGNRGKAVFEGSKREGLFKPYELPHIRLEG